MTTNQSVALVKTGIPALALSEAELMQVLSSSLYPGANPESIKLVIGYCKAAGLDPMQKPVHIVPMNGRDVIMPGIGSYRVQAARSGEYAGISEPEFGADETKVFDGGVSITFPQWCKVTVKRSLSSGHVAEFSATERWIENYATRGKDKNGRLSNAPNAMWTKRPYAQLAKCAEAQALRKAFPEIGAAPTADEMEGKEFAPEEYIDGATGEVIQSKPKKAEPLPPCRDEDITEKLPKWKEYVIAGKKTPEGIIAWICTKATLTFKQREKILGELEFADAATEAPPQKSPMSDEHRAFVAEFEAAEAA